ncbi:hypothetical protein [Tessaracoccus oleiagri]|uniref:Uncharacterized protein n=1 Tax=Tessaracoccus oleiagri TaxID=686624 RepID=A0A1G9MUS9_9ACTN|nr:hypothetical protein [Tessaracoccus oleiagri]SDL77998.1 hypothetical protein SAMN04488242_2767 [Tessaracoccus oleiagri]
MATVLPWVLIVAAGAFAAVALFALVRLLVDLVARKRTGTEV